MLKIDNTFNAGPISTDTTIGGSVVGDVNISNESQEDAAQTEVIAISTLEGVLRYDNWWKIEHIKITPIWNSKYKKEIWYSVHRRLQQTDVGWKWEHESDSGFANKNYILIPESNTDRLEDVLTARFYYRNNNIETKIGKEIMLTLGTDESKIDYNYSVIFDGMRDSHEDNVFFIDPDNVYIPLPGRDSEVEIGKG